MLNQSTARLIFFVLAMATYLAVPAYMILEYEWRLEQGETYRFRTGPRDPYNPFTGRSMVLHFDQDRLPKHNDSDDLWEGDKVFVTVGVDEEGFAFFLDYYESPPEDQPFLITEVKDIYDEEIRIDIPFDRYYLNETLAPKAESIYRNMSSEDRDAVYIDVKLLEGQALIQELYIEDVPIIDFLENQSED